MLDWRIRSGLSGGGFGSQPGHEPGVRRGPKHASDLSAVVLDQAHAVDHYVVNEPVRARLRHDVVEPDIRTVFGFNHGANERDTPDRAHLFTDKANGRRPIPWQFASDDAEVSPQEAITEELDELVAFDHAERTPFGLEHTARRARDIEPESRELTDFVLRLTGVGGLAETVVAFRKKSSSCSRGDALAAGLGCAMRRMLMRSDADATSVLDCFTLHSPICPSLQINR